MIFPWASLTKPESIGCCTSACTSVMSPLATARTRIVDAMMLFSLAAAAADGDFDLFAGAVDLAAGFDERHDLAGFCHFEPVGHRACGAGRQFVAGRQRVGVLRNDDRNRRYVGKR